MNTWDKWVKRPQTVWLRRALLQVHLWSGIALGIYITVVCVSGSAAVFDSELITALTPDATTVEITGAPLSRAQLLTAAQSAHPNATITRINRPSDPHEAAVVSLGRAAYADQRFIDPYTGKDLGTARPFGLRMVAFFTLLHRDLLMGYTGRLINGVGGFLIAALSLTGMVIWWPGIRRWRDSLSLRTNVNPKRFNWGLHSTIGFWAFGIILMWSITGAELVYPRIFERALDVIHVSQAVNLGLIFRPVHVGNFGGWPVKALWVLMGLSPAALFVTGFIIWWCRTLEPWRKRHLVPRKALPSGSPEAVAADPT